MPSQPSHADLLSLLEFAQRIANGADQLLLQGWGHAPASQKADGTLVTQTDDQVDEFITQQLVAAYPDHAILSEERTTSYNPAVQFTWVIDPLDGTTNFVRGLAIWGVSIALLWYGIPLIGVLSFVSLRECYSAITNGGAFLNGTRIQSSNRASVDNQHFLMLCTRTQRRYHVHTPLKPRILGSAAYHIAAVANGSALAGIEATPKLWDIAAALLILVEAGGTYRRLDVNEPIFPLRSVPQNYAAVAYPLLAAANDEIMREMELSITDA